MTAAAPAAPDAARIGERNPGRSKERFGAPGGRGRLLRTLVIGPEAVGWDRSADWRGLGYFRPPDPAAAARQHREIRSTLEARGVELVEPDGRLEGLTPDAVYCHDASIPTRRGAILMRMGKAGRWGEPEAHARIYATRGMPVLGAIRAPGLMEGGDVVWLDERTLLAGEGYRTNAAGIAQLRELLAGDGVEVIPAPLPHWEGPEFCLHLMSLLSALDERTMLVDRRFLGVPTLRLLEDRGLRLIPIVEEERETMAANVLALGGGALLALAANRRTNERLRGIGFEVLTYEGGEISGNGSGGPTCLTRPLVRDPA